MSPAHTPVIDVTDLTKTFGRASALDGLNLKLDEGEIHGFLGPNGAGKSTTIRIILGLIKATSGTARVLGRDPWAEPVATHRDIAYVPGDVSLWPNLTGGEAIDLLTSLRGGADPDRRERLIREFEFDPRKRARTYSKGNRQKVALIAAFARPAKLYILDEPSSGLDPVMESVFQQQVRRARDEGSTVLLSSHILSEVEQLCDRVTIIRSGVAVESGTLAELRHLSRTTFRVPGLAADALTGVAGIHDLRATGDTLEFETDDAAIPAVLAALSALGAAALTVEPASLESLFLRHYSDGVAR
ncbi:ABC-2 type transport system ATP-binding protein [Microbacteriaceae bacterium SG_E_30_P1]|uniref:ABC-2 type transport system ATP-binding protein n=1 Tax=Antiquaquibacter oligotrophicus TaxID=2880260 RepID=A0ABT6KSF1_9MICO|nr:ABC transporter ATP-binding protein [Antiquaquibacter oligotrophicus]MDH6182117.1 ABC-2 type transport system ATP-binding protein [Antiquaquibacter oligotrophicus]UDF12220.1 ABC transporter ATP-binding protein [Antiquaquibacter oligotrophicus]